MRRPAVGGRSRRRRRGLRHRAPRVRGRRRRRAAGARARAAGRGRLDGRERRRPGDRQRPADRRPPRRGGEGAVRSGRRPGVGVGHDHGRAGPDRPRRGPRRRRDRTPCPPSDASPAFLHTNVAFAYSRGRTRTQNSCARRKTRAHGGRRIRRSAVSVPWACDLAPVRHRHEEPAGVRPAAGRGCVDLRLRGHGAGHPAHRARAVEPELRRAPPLAHRTAAWTSRSSATSPTSTTRSSPRPPRRAGRGGSGPRPTSAPSPRPTTRWAACRRRSSRGRPGTSRRWSSSCSGWSSPEHAYAAGGDVYFDVRSFPDYGALSGQRLDDVVQGETEAVGKRDPRDFTLWKAAKPGEPAWPTPWGPGRPGWHLECSAMATFYLGPRVRHPRRRHRPRLPAPRERARAEQRGGRPVRAVLAAQRLGHPGRGEDEQVAGQHAVHRRAAAPGARRRAALLPRRPALPLDDRVLRRGARRGRGRVPADRVVRAPRAGAGRPARGRRRRCRRGVRRRAGRRPGHPGRARGRARRRPRGQHRAGRGRPRRGGEPTRRPCAP